VENDVGIKEYERVDDLQFGGLRIIQSRKGFRFGMDAVLLSHFADVRPGDRVVDLGTGTGIIPILLSGHTKGMEYVGLEIQPEMAEMASRSVLMNGLEGKIKIVNGDLRLSHELLGYNSFDVVTCNPPYERKGGGVVCQEMAWTLARHEEACTLSDVAHAAFNLLRQGGRLSIIIRADRAVDVLMMLKESRMEPKRIRLVCPSVDKSPNLMLAEATRGGNPGVRWEPPLIVYGADGAYSPELKAIYGRAAEG
jgi:tRNA1Val (adenine37-N6)-methyltransferase